MSKIIIPESVTVSVMDTCLTVRSELSEPRYEGRISFEGVLKDNPKFIKAKVIHSFFDLQWDPTAPIVTSGNGDVGFYLVRPKRADGQRSAVKTIITVFYLES